MTGLGAAGEPRKMRRYVVTWRSNEYEWNGRGGRSFKLLDSAMREYETRIDEGCWDVRLWDNGAVLR